MRSAKGRLPPHPTHSPHLRGGGVGRGGEEEEEGEQDSDYGPNTRSLPRHFRLAGGGRQHGPGLVPTPASFFDPSKDQVAFPS